MDKITTLIKSLKELRWYTATLLFLGVVLYSFHSEITRLIDLRIADKDIVVHAIENDLLIDKALSELLTKTDSDRAYIFRFHNGDTYYNGTHKSKMSNDYEVVRDGVVPQAQRLQNLPTSLYLPWIKETIDGKMFYTDIEGIKDLRVRYSLRSQGIKAIACAPYYRNGKLFAIIGIDYIRETTIEDKESFDSNKESAKDSFFEQTENIGSLLI